jgi:chromosome partitioning protein
MRKKMTKIFSLTTSKGGAGKTTLARSLACHWLSLNFKVGVIDADPQASFFSRHDPEGLAQGLIIIANPEEVIESSILELKEQRCSHIIIDTGGFRNRTTVKALINSDLALIPLKPSADDVAGAIDTHNLIKELNETPERAKNPINYRMILTMTQQGTVISRHIKDELKSMGYKILINELLHRVAYPEAAIKGIAPNLLDPEGPAARDIAKIVVELNEIITS